MPSTLLGGRVRTTTVALAVAFLGVLALYLAVRPPPVLPARTSGTAPAVVVPQPSRSPEPSPEPSRLPSPTPVPTVAPTPSEEPSAEPSPGASPSPTPAPAPSRTEVLPSSSVSTTPAEEPTPAAG